MNKLIREIGRSRRMDLLTTLKRHGGMTVKELAAHFHMSYMGIKGYCLELEKDGYLEARRRPPTQTGRPELIYRLTRRSHELFPEADNPLALEVLEAVQQAYGPAAPTKILFGIFAQRTEKYRAQLQFPTLSERARALARLREAEGHIAEFQDGGPTPRGTNGDVPGDGAHENGAPGGGMCIVEYHSPIEDLLRRYPILARLEKELFERALNCAVQREEQTVAEAYRCTFHLG